MSTSPRLTVAAEAQMEKRESPAATASEGKGPANTCVMSAAPMMQRMNNDMVDCPAFPNAGKAGRGEVLSVATAFEDDQHA